MREQANKLTRVYRVEFEKEPEGGYTAYFPGVPGCITWGETLDAAREHAKEALSSFIEALWEAGDPIPASDITGVQSDTTNGADDSCSSRVELEMSLT